MKSLGALMFCLALLVITAQAQTSASQTGQPNLELGRYMWAELGYPGGPCTDCAGLPQATLDYRWNSRPDKYIALVELRNRGSKAIKSIDLDFVFVDAVTNQEFLRYRVHSDRQIGPGQKREVRQVVRDVEREADNYIPARPGKEILSRATSSQVKLAVTRIEYVDGSVWQEP
jgi:hypothetical protein